MLKTLWVCWSNIILIPAHFLLRSGRWESRLGRWVFGLPVGEFPCEEYVPPFVELEMLKKQDLELCSPYWEVFCHFFIYERLKDRSRGGLAYSAWAEYLNP